MSVTIDSIKCKKKHKHNFKTIYIDKNRNSNSSHVTLVDMCQESFFENRLSASNNNTQQNSPVKVDQSENLYWVQPLQTNPNPTIKVTASFKTTNP